MQQQSNKIKTALHLDKHKRKGDGKSQFKLRVYVGDKKYLYIRTGHFMDAKFWVDRKIKSAKGNPNASKLKAKTDELIAKCEGIVNDLIDNNKTITKKAVEKALFAPPPSQTKYAIYLDFMMDCHRKDIASDKIRERSISRELCAMKVMRAYDNETPIQDIDAEWLREYEVHLIQVKQYAVSTRAMHFHLLRKTVIKALAAKLISYDPFFGFSFERAGAGNRQFLTLEELEHLHELFITGHFLGEGKKRRSAARHHVLQVFLASCYTGLRYGDVSRMDRSWFYGDIIRATLNKSRGKKTVTIPVSRRLKEVLADEGQEVYYRKPFTINYTDTILVEIMKEAKIHKHIEPTPIFSTSS